VVISGSMPIARVRANNLGWTDPSLVALGLWARAAREGSGLSQRDLELLSGVDQTVISRFERALRPQLSATAVARMLVAVGLCPVEHPPGSGLLVRGNPRHLDEQAAEEWYAQLAEYWRSLPEDEQRSRLEEILSGDDPDAF